MEPEKSLTATKALIVILMMTISSCSLIGEENPAPEASKKPGSSIIPSVGAEKGLSFFQEPDISVVDKCTKNVVRGSDRPSLRKLTKQEIENTVRSIFIGVYGPTIDFMSAYPSDVQNDKTEYFNAGHSESQIENWALISLDISKKVSVNSNFRKNILAVCLQSISTPPSDICWNSFIENFGRKVFRRPLTVQESEEFFDKTKTNTSLAAIQKIIHQMLRSPQFMFHIEFGSDLKSKERIRLTQHEIASRLSYGLSAAPPDDELSRAADLGELNTISDLQPHAERLSQSNYAKEKIKDFASEWLRVNNIFEPNKYVAESEGITQGPLSTSDTQMKTEILDYFEHFFFNGGNFKDLMTAKIAFPRNSTYLSKVYGLTLPAGGYAVGQAAATPDHPGLLTKAGILSTSDSLPSIILRGVMIRRRFLCTILPSPDFSIVAERSANIQTLSPISYSNHDIVEAATYTSSCIGCHKVINPFGNILESYNSVGALKDKQYYFDRCKTAQGGNCAGAMLFSTFPLPSTQHNVLVDAGLPTSYSNAEEITDMLSKSSSAKACMAVRLFRVIEQRPEEISDSCLLKDIVSKLDSNDPNSLLRAYEMFVVNEDIFWRKEK